MTQYTQKKSINNNYLTVVPFPDNKHTLLDEFQIN